MTIDPRTPVVIGGGQLTVRPGEEGTHDPVDMVIEAAQRAAGDSILAAADVVATIPVLSKRYANLAGLIAPRLGASGARTWQTTGGGNATGALLGRLSADILAGDIGVAVLAGVESWRTSSAARRDGVMLPWIDEPDGAEPDEVIGGRLEMSHPAEAALEIRHPTEVYPLFEHALRGHAGRSIDEHRAHLGRLWSRFSEVAARHPHAWYRRAHSPDEIAVPSPTNRMVSDPYTKLLCSNEMVDQAAVAVVCSAEQAEALGVPPDRWVFPVFVAEAAAPTASERFDLWASPAVRAAGDALWAGTGLGPDDIAHVDIYSCFPSAVQVQAAELGFGLDRELTLTGGMRFFGGPWNAYPMHSLATMVDLLRASPNAFGLLTANGGVISKQATVLLSSSPPAEPFRRVSAQAAADSHPRRAVDSSPDGTGTVETYTVNHDREGPTRGIVAALLPDGRRAWGIASGDDLAALRSSDPLGRPVTLRDGAAHL